MSRCLDEKSARVGRGPDIRPLQSVGPQCRPVHSCDGRSHRPLPSAAPRHSLVPPPLQPVTRPVQSVTSALHSSYTTDALPRPHPSSEGVRIE